MRFVDERVRLRTANQRDDRHEQHTVSQPPLPSSTLNSKYLQQPHSDWEFGSLGTTARASESIYASRPLVSRGEMENASTSHPRAPSAERRSQPRGSS